MLEDVRDVSPFLEPFDKSARLAPVAFVELERWHRLDQPLREVGNLCRGDVLELAQPNVAGDYGREAPVIGSAEGSNAGDFELNGVEFEGSFGYGRCHA